MCFLIIKACQHILLHQIHKIMIFKKASYDLFNILITWEKCLFILRVTNSMKEVYLQCQRLYFLHFCRHTIGHIDTSTTLMSHRVVCFNEVTLFLSFWVCMAQVKSVWDRKTPFTTSCGLFLNSIEVSWLFASNCTASLTSEKNIVKYIFCII